MRLRTELYQASRVGLAGRMLGDAQQAFLQAGARTDRIWSRGGWHARRAFALHMASGAAAGMLFRSDPSLQIAAPVT